MEINVSHKLFSDAESFDFSNEPPDRLQEMVAELYSRQSGQEEEALLSLDFLDVEPLAEFDPERLEEFHIDEIGNLFEKQEFKEEPYEEEGKATPAIDLM